MKNIAIPLLLAGSAKAEAKKKAAMLFDYAMPEPILIASSWTGDVCVDAASDVSAALSALQTAQDAVTESSEGVAALESTYIEALEARVEAVAAVTELADSMETAVTNNNAAIDTWFDRKGDWQAAAVVASVGQANKITLVAATASALDLLNAAKLEYYGADTAGGLLADTETARVDLATAQAIADNTDASTVGSLLLRNAQSTSLGNTNCAQFGTAIVGVVGDADYQLVCASSGLSLAEMDTAADATLVTRDAANLEMARTLLLEREFYAIDQTIGWAKKAAEDDSNFSASTPDPFLISTLLATPALTDRQAKPRALDGTYSAGTWYSNMGYALFTNTAVTQSQTQVLAGMELFVTDTSLTELTPGDAATVTATANWLTQLRLVYGSTTTVGPQALDGDGTATNSAEYDLEQTSSTGSQGFILVARAQVEALRALVVSTYTNTPMNTDASTTGTVASEITSADGYAGAYTLLDIGGNNGAAAATGVTSVSVTWGTPQPDAEGGSNLLVYTIGFDSSAAPGDVGGTGTAAGSMCAAACSALAPWKLDSTTNLPEVQANNSATECTGFQVTVSDDGGATKAAAAGADPVCVLFWGGIPVIDSTISTDVNNAVIGAYSRKWSVLAYDYVTAVAAANTVSDGASLVSQWDLFNAGMTAWNTAYLALIDARAALNLATQYTADITAAYTNGSTGTQELYEVAGASGAKYDYDADVTAYTTASGLYDADILLYNAKVISIATARSDYALAQAQWESNNALISKLTVLHEIATAASGASLIAEQALDGIWVDAGNDSAAAADDYDGVLNADSGLYENGQVQALATALENMTSAEDAVTGAAGTESLLGVYAASPDGSGDLGSLYTYRATASQAFNVLNDAMDALSLLNDTIEGKQRDVESRLADHLSAIVACKVENYDNYTQTLQLAIGAREDDLEDILALVTQAEADAPAAGEAGWRCEKALSNGTFRPTRGETTCNENLCCGAASVPVGEAVMTIETCQSSDTTTYSYVPPRGPMETTAPAADTFPFVCIEGAQKLAAAASALATAVYMLA